MLTEKKNPAAKTLLLCGRFSPNEKQHEFKKSTPLSSFIFFYMKAKGRGVMYFDVLGGVYQ